MNTTLLIMAAGLGSRYGSDKQIDRIGPHGEILMEYTVHDAAAAGFDKVVFVLKRPMEQMFRETVGDRVARKMDVEYAFQDYGSLPGGFTPPAGRVKPYGTVHAVLCAKDLIHEPFAVVNADDYYGPEAFRAMAASLREMAGRPDAASMVAYRLRNTLSENGAVTRGVCRAEADGCLGSITEVYAIRRAADGTVRSYDHSPEGEPVDGDSPVSMNFWGLTPAFFPAAEKRFVRFLAEGAGDPMKREYVLPTLIDEMMREDGLRVRMLRTDAVWFGITYREDKPGVAEALSRLHAQGVYPEEL